jgi:hypothetical protein
MSVVIHVDRVVLHGWEMSRSEQRRLRIALESELARLFAAGSVRDELVAERRVPSVGPIDIHQSPRGGAARFGSALAAGVHRGVAEVESPRTMDAPKR